VYVCIHLPLDADAAVRRDAGRARGGGRVGEAVIRRMAAHFEPPAASSVSPDHAWDARHAWEVRAEGAGGGKGDRSAAPASGEDAPALFDAAALLRRLAAAAASGVLVPPPAAHTGVSDEQRAADRAVTATNAVHAADVILRELVGEVVRGGVSGAAAAAAKRRVLDAVRQEAEAGRYGDRGEVPAGTSTRDSLRARLLSALG
jgi:hypothetical protein